MILGRYKFCIGGLLIISSIIFLIITSTKSSSQYFLTVDEIRNEGQQAIGKSVRLSGAIIGSTIEYDPDNLILTFVIAHIPGSNSEIESLGGLARVLHDAVIDPARNRQRISYSGVKPDLLQDEAQAIVTGKLGEDGIFYADELLLKCPTKYEDALPEQVSDK